MGYKLKVICNEHSLVLIRKKLRLLSL